MGEQRYISSKCKLLATYMTVNSVRQIGNNLTVTPFLQSVKRGRLGVLAEVTKTTWWAQRATSL